MSTPRLAIQEHQDRSPTARQRQVMLLTAHGFSNKQIARQLNITEGTVKTHLHAIYDRLGVRKRTALAAIVFRASHLNLPRGNPSWGPNVEDGSMLIAQYAQWPK